VIRRPVGFDLGMRKDTRREFAAIPILLALLGVLFAIMLLAELGTWGWIIFAVACVVALVLVAVLLARRPKHASALDAPSTAARRADEPDGTHRVVVVCDDSCTSPGFVDEIVSHAAGRQLEVFVTAPALGSRLSQWTGDDAARHDAGEHVSATLRALEEAGVSARGEVGARDPIRAADDALREFPADEVVFATHPGADANWLEQGVVEVARARYDVPVTNVVVGAG
jgi:GABA permease